MDREEIRNRIAPIFHDVFDDDTIVPHDRLTAADVADWDSLSNIRLIVAVEQAFGFEFTTGEIDSLANVGEFITVIADKTRT